MSGRRARHMPIFARTFLLLLAALLVAHGIGMAIMFWRASHAQPPITISALAGLLSTRMPPSHHGTTVNDTARPPDPPSDYRRHPGLEAALARWMIETTADGIRVHVPDGAKRPPAPFREPNEKPGTPPPRPPWSPDSPMPPVFLASARQHDGNWRVIASEAPLLDTPGRVFAALMLLGGLALLPLAWWFSHALARPIRHFAAAADRMGRDTGAPPLTLEGPAEIVRASRSFNRMQQRLGRLVREREEMVGAIAHDLRTPLARLSFRLEALPEQVRAGAEADIQEMSEMIQSALDFLRDQHAPARARHSLDLSALVAEIADGYTARNHPVTVSDRPDAAPFHGDAIALRRMLGNLIDNALRYGNCARLRLARDGEDYVIDIDDDGPGVDAFEAERLFMPFVRGERSRNRKTGGTGLGLPSARSVALVHGGDIALENRPGGGLRAHVRLPAAAAAETPFQ